MITSGEQLKELFIRYSGKTLLPDANLLVIYFIGCVAKEQIGRHPRTSGFTKDDFLLLAKIIYHFQQRGRVLTTPHILTEVSNLLGESKVPGSLHGKQLAAFFKYFASQMGPSGLKEEWLSAKELVRTEFFERYGLSDAAIAQFASNKVLVLSCETKLVRELQARKFDAVLFQDLQREFLT